MIASLHSEWLKWLTVRSHLVLTVLAALLPLVVTAIFVLVTGDPAGVSAEDIAVIIGVSVTISVLLLGVSSLILVTSEYGHQTVRVTYAVTPQRWRVSVSKTVLNAAVAVLVAALSVLLSLLLAAAVLDGRGGSLSIEDSDGAWRRLLAMVVAALVFALVGTGLGLLVRNSALGVTVFVLWPLMLENLAIVLLGLAGLDSIGRWFPLQSVMSEMTTSGADTLPWPWALIWPVGFGIALIATGMLIDRRRDA